MLPLKLVRPVLKCPIKSKLPGIHLIETLSFTWLFKRILGTNCRLFGAVSASRTPAESNKWVKACLAEHWISHRQGKDQMHKTQGQQWAVANRNGDCIRYVYVDAIKHLERPECNLFGFCSAQEKRYCVEKDFFFCLSLITLQYVNRNNKKCHDCVFTSWMTLVYCLLSI